MDTETFRPDQAVIKTGHSEDVPCNDSISIAALNAEIGGIASEKFLAESAGIRGGPVRRL
jgi:hypothetical protein